MCHIQISLRSGAASSWWWMTRISITAAMPAVPGDICAFCQTTEGAIEVEHLLPSSRGGTDAWENLALACQTCNQRKGSRTPEEAGMSLLLNHTSPRLHYDAAEERAGSYFNRARAAELLAMPSVHGSA